LNIPDVICVKSITIAVRLHGDLRREPALDRGHALAPNPVSRSRRTVATLPN
jgi:hypothetical protein